MPEVTYFVKWVLNYEKQWLVWAFEIQLKKNSTDNPFALDVCSIEHDSTIHHSYTYFDQQMTNHIKP